MKTWFAIDGTLEPIEYEGPSFFRFPEELAERVLLRYSSVGEWVLAKSRVFHPLTEVKVRYISCVQ